MYLIYEDIPDNARNVRLIDENTIILGLYNDKDMAIKTLERIVETRFNEVGKYDWFYKKVQSLSDKTIITMYEIYEGEINNFDCYYSIKVKKIDITKGE